MESLPNSFFQQEPVVFFSSGPPTQGFCGNDQGSGSQRHYRRCGGGPGFEYQRNGNHGFSFAFLKPLAMAILSLFALSIAVRTVLFLLAVVFSPPVLFLCLFFLLISQSGGQYHNSWNAREFQQCFRNPRRRFHRFFSSNNGNRCGNRRGQWRAAASDRRTPSNASQASRAPAAPPMAPTRQEPQQQQATAAPTGRDDFELISPFNLMMAAAAAAESATQSEGQDNATPNTNEQAGDRIPSNSTPTQQQKVPVHRNETDEELTIAMDISGFDIANIQITVENDVLCIHGERTNKIGDSFIVEECFDLDKEVFDEDTVTASASEGVLEVKVQKKAAPQPRVISIQTDKK